MPTPTLNGAKLILSKNGRQVRSIRLGDLLMRELKSGGMHNGWALPGYVDPEIDLVLVALARDGGNWVIEGRLNGELKRYKGGHANGVFKVSEAQD